MNLPKETEQRFKKFPVVINYNNALSSNLLSKLKKFEQ